MKNFKHLYIKHKEIILYLAFGLITTVVSLLACFATLKIGVVFLHDENGEPTELLDILGSTMQWISGVLVAFVTNKKWVFIDADANTSTAKQLGVFASGRILTFLLDYAVTYLGALGLSALMPFANRVELLGGEWNLNEIAAKIVAAVLVIIGNYVFSKLLVFRKNPYFLERK